jgi:protein-tyrosine phosphatase
MTIALNAKPSDLTMHPAPPESLWLGHAGDLADAGAVAEAGIEAIVDLALNEPPTRVARDLVYCRFPLIDGTGNSSALLTCAVSTLVALLRSGTRTLVCCSAGSSRSPAIAAAALAVLRGSEPDACLKQLLSHQVVHDVSPGLWADVRAVLPTVHDAAWKPKSAGPP